VIARSRPDALLPWAALLVVVGWRLQDFVGLGMTTTDQLVFSTDLVGRGVWEATLEHARQQGRVYFLLTKPIDLLAATYATAWTVQAANLALFACVPFLIAWMAFRERAERLVFLLAFWTLCAPGWFSTPPAAYPIVPGLPLALAGLAAVAGRRYVETGSPLAIAAFGALAFAAFFQYEPGALIAAALLLWFVHTRAPAPAQRRALYGATALSFALYVVAYAAWRWTYPTAYEGGTPGELAPLAVGRVLAAYAIGALPLTNLVGGMLPVTLGDAMVGRQVLSHPPLTLTSLLRGVEWMDVVVCTAGVALLWSMLARTRTSPAGPRSRTATLAQQLCLGLLLLLLANVLLALTAKYQLWARGWRPYLTSYYALFGWAVVVTALSARVVRRPAVTALILAFATSFLYSSAYNHVAARHVRANFAKWHAVAALAACRDHLGSYRSFVVPAAFAGVFERSANWSLYWRDWTSLAFGSALHIAAAAETIDGDPGAVASVELDRDDDGHLRAIVGRGGSRGFVIHRGEAAVAEQREELRCRDGYRISTFAGERPIGALDAAWRVPDIDSGMRADAKLFVVPDQDTELAVEALYLAFFDRAADPGGLSFWADRVRRAGGTVRDVAEGFAGAAMQEKAPLAGDFDARLAQSYQRLVGRPPRAEEAARLGRFRERRELVALLPWLAAADLLAAGDPGFARRLRLAQFYTQVAYGAIGWRADLWEQAVRIVDERPDGLPQAMAIIRR
jgi:hypothetical protein